MLRKGRQFTSAFRLWSQGPREYQYAGKPVEREEAREALRLEEERLSNWQPRGQSMVDEQLLYDRWLQSLENDKDVIRALGFATLLQFRNRAWEEEQKWRREANEAGQLRQQEWKQRAAELKEEQARDANDDMYGRGHPTTATRDPVENDTEPMDMTANIARQTQLEEEDETAELEGIAAEMEHREGLNRRSAEESKGTGARETAVEVRNRGDTYEEWLRTRPRHVLDELYQSGELQDGEVVSIWGSKMPAVPCADGMGPETSTRRRTGRKRARQVPGRPETSQR